MYVNYINLCSHNIYNNADVDYTMKLFKHFELELLKIGKVSRHSTKIRGKRYDKGKVYLFGNTFTNKDYELYDLGGLSIEEVFSTIKGKELLLFFPEHKENFAKLLKVL